jgi:hypothetical protein
LLGICDAPQLTLRQSNAVPALEQFP